MSGRQVHRFGPALVQKMALDPMGPVSHLLVLGITVFTANASNGKYSIITFCVLFIDNYINHIYKRYLN